MVCFITNTSVENRYDNLQKAFQEFFLSENCKNYSHSMW